MTNCPWPRRRSAAAFTLFLLIGGCAQPANRANLGNETDTPRSDPLLEVEREEVPTGVLEGLANYLQVDGSLVDLEEVVAYSDSAFVLFEFAEEGRRVRGFGSVQRTADVWRVTVDDQVLVGGWEELPPPGSNSVLVAQVTSGDLVALGGFVDPDIDNAEVRTEGERLVDSAPVYGGQVVLVGRAGDYVRMQSGSHTVYTAPLVHGDLEISHEVPFGAKSERVARELILAAADSADSRAGDLASGVDEQLFLDGLGAVIASLHVDLESSQEMWYGYRFDVEDDSGTRGHLAVYLTSEAGEPRVWFYELFMWRP